MMTSYKEEDKTLATATHSSLEGGRGDFDSGDYEIQRLEVVQGMGKLSKDRRFHLGDLVLMREHIIPQPVKVTVFGFNKFFVQNIAYQEGVFPQEFDTKEEVLASGGNLDKGKKAGEDTNNFVDNARLIVALELPPELAGVPGVLEFEDKLVVKAEMKLRGKAYSENIRHLNTTEMPLKKKGKLISSKRGTLSVEEVKSGNFDIQVPIFKLSGDNTDAYVEFLRSVF